MHKRYGLKTIRGVGRLYLVPHTLEISLGTKGPLNDVSAANRGHIWSITAQTAPSVPTGSYKRTVALQSGLPLWLSGREPTSQCRRRGFDPWVRKIPWRRKWQLAPVFLPGESNGQRSLAAIHGSQRVERGLVIKQQQPICGSKITRGFCLLFSFFMMSHRMKFQGTAFPY